MNKRGFRPLSAASDEAPAAIFGSGSTLLRPRASPSKVVCGPTEFQPNPTTPIQTVVTKSPSRASASPSPSHSPGSRASASSPATTGGKSQLLRTSSASQLRRVATTDQSRKGVNAYRTALFPYLNGESAGSTAMRLCLT